MNYWDDVGFPYPQSDRWKTPYGVRGAKRFVAQEGQGLLRSPDRRGQQLAAEQARRTYQGLLARDMIGIEPYALWAGRATQDPDVGFQLAPMDVVPAGAIGKGLAGLIAAGTGGLLARQLMKQPVNRSSVSMMGYHGGPTKWAPEPDAPLGRPRLEKVGTGEGAQVYGHGFYVAENPKVAGEYKVDLSRGLPTVEYKGKLLPASTGLYQGLEFEDKAARTLALWVRGGGSVEQWKRIEIERLLASNARHAGDDELERLIVAANNSEIAAIKAVDPSQIKHVEPGHLYKMDVPDADVAKMLDYDAPLSQQPVGVLRILEESGVIDALRNKSNTARASIDAKLKAAGKPPQRWSKQVEDFEGRAAYEQLSVMLGGDKATSEYLASKGIPGLKYLDQGSRPFLGVTPKTHHIGRDVSGRWGFYGNESGYFDADLPLFSKEADAAAWLRGERGTRNMVIWDDDLLKRIKVLERDGVKPEIVPGVPRGQEMVVTHNLTPENLAHAERMGGIPMPSLGVAKTGRPIEGYGDIVLIGDKQMAKSSARNPVAPADSYTVRYPKVLQDINKDSRADALELFTAPIREIDPKLADEVLSKPWRLYDELGELRHYWPARALYLKDIGREDVLRKALKRYQKEKESMSRVGRDRGYVLDQEISDAGLDQGWYSYSENLVDRLRQSGVRIDERIFKGFTPAGNRRYAAHTLDNVMKEMRWEARDAYHGASIYGMGAIRARLAPRFKNLKAVVEARGRLVGDDEFKKAKEEIETAFIKLSEKLAKHRKGYDPKDFGMLDRVGEDLIDYSRRGRRGLDDFYDDVPEALLKEMDELVTAIKKMPTEYFEIKPNRVVQVDEFSGALVPDDVSEDVIARLNRMGVNRIEKYSRPSMTSKSGKSKALDKFQDMMFGVAPLGLIGLEEDREGLLR